ncbi:MAG: hypothetical protein ACKVS6_02580 [Planctomycetota bacterium]
MTESNENEIDTNQPKDRELTTVPSPAEKAVIHAAAVLQTLAENQRVLRESTERAERTELLLQNVAGLNDTFRAIATTQSRLLESVENADRRRAEAESRARRSRNWSFVLAAGLLGMSMLGFFAIQRALDTNENKHSETVLAAIRADVEDRRAERDKELQTIAVSFRDALADRKNYEDKIVQLTNRESELQKAAEAVRGDKTVASDELDKTKKELEDVREKLKQYQNQALQEGDGISRVMALLNSKGLSAEALRQTLKSTHSNINGQINSQINNNEAAASQPGVNAGEKDPFEQYNIPAPDPLAPVSEAVIKELNSMLAFASGTDMRIVDVGGRSGTELRDAYFTRYNKLGKPAGFVAARNVRIEESAFEPRIVMKLEDGYELSGSTKIPYVHKTLEFRSLDPADWKRRIPELFTGVVTAGSAAQTPELTKPNITETPPDPAAIAAMLRLNKLFAAHTDYLRLQFVEISSVEPEALVGVTLQTLVIDRGAKEPRIDQTIRARKLIISYLPKERRLELDFEDGARGRERPIAFPGGKLHMLIPNVDASEIENGETPLPIRWVGGAPR